MPPASSDPENNNPHSQNSNAPEISSQAQANSLRASSNSNSHQADSISSGSSYPEDGIESAMGRQDSEQLSEQADHESLAPRQAARAQNKRIALMGNPNTGKTTLFNRLCGLRAKTGNFSGVTLEAREGKLNADTFLIDLPGIYSLSLNQPESQICRQYLSGQIADPFRPKKLQESKAQQVDAFILITDGSQLERNLALVGEILAIGLPTVLAINMCDRVKKSKRHIHVDKLSQKIGCPVVEICARSGQGSAALIKAIESLSPLKPCSPMLPIANPLESGAGPDIQEKVQQWAKSICSECIDDSKLVADKATDRLDDFLTHSLLGPLAFLFIMSAMFYVVFSLAGTPMDLIEQGFGVLSGLVNEYLPEGLLKGLLADGVIGGISGTIVFLPQICLLFFMLTLLEDSGYLARAVFVVDRWLKPFGLPGQAFVPLLSSHACALPGIMSARLIPDRRDRLATILVAPLMSCSARLPVYVLLVGALSVAMGWSAIESSLAFVACFAIGVLIALLTSALIRKSILRGESTPLIIELPAYKRPSLRLALRTAYDEALGFTRKAGTVILAICMILWWLSEFPQHDKAKYSPALKQMEAELELAKLEVARYKQALEGNLQGEQDSEAKLDHLNATVEEQEGAFQTLEAHEHISNSYVGQMGKTISPVFEPLGFDWQMTVAVLTSFAAREVFVSTLCVIYRSPEDDDLILERLTKKDGAAGNSPILTPQLSLSLLVFFIIALQCLPTLSVTRRETGNWKWPLLQFSYLSILAYVCSLATFHLASAFIK